MIEHEGNEMSAFELPKAGKQFRICDTGQVLTYEQMTSGIDADLLPHDQDSLELFLSVMGAEATDE